MATAKRKPAAGVPRKTAARAPRTAATRRAKAADIVQGESARDVLIRGLRDAHAMEKQSEAMISAALGRIESYPQVRARLQTHLKETRAQVKAVDALLAGMGEKRSALKDKTAVLAGTMGKLTQAMTRDEILKNALAMFAFKSFEAASYAQLLVLAEKAGADGAVEPLKQALDEERAMASWLGGSAREVVHRFLELASEGGRQAGR